MAVCNLFNGLNNVSGNFMLFSQYVEDVTRNYTSGDSWKIVPTRFVALDINYSKYNDPNNSYRNIVLNNGKYDLNTGIPTYFQNCFENACAYGKSNYENWVLETSEQNNTWNSEISRNLFWNAMFDGGFVSAVQYGSETSTIKRIPEVVYYGDIAMHSYNEHQGMGYGEIYCYIPTDAEKMNCQVVCIGDSNPNGRNYDATNTSLLLEGHNDKYIEDYPQHYYYNRDFSFSFDDNEISKLVSYPDSKYNINTIVVLYSIFTKQNDDWNVVYANLPMGMYITGKFDENNAITNPVTKYVTTSFSSGTSYGLRICTRFSANPNGAILSNSEMIVDDSGYTNMCQLMTAMNENLSKMMDIVRSSNDTSQQYRDLLSIFKNNKTNVPYVKDVNGTDCWFVNGKFVSAVNSSLQFGCQTISPNTVKKRIENLMDDDPTNDNTYILEPNECDCVELSEDEITQYLDNLQ